jgi:hypothetical protein
MRFSIVRILGAILAIFGGYLTFCLLTPINVSPRRDIDAFLFLYWIVALVSIVVGVWICAFRRTK